MNAPAMTTSAVAIEILPESALRSMVDLMVRLIEACGAVVIMIGAVVAIVKFVAALGRRDINQFSAVRLSLARFLVLGLEFQLAADVLRTAISPSFSEIGKLAAIAAIRTLLNYFLNREIAQEPGTDGGRAAGTAGRPQPGSVNAPAMTTSAVAIEILPESALRSMVDLMVRLIEACGAVVIMIGAVVAIVKFVAALGRRDINQFSAVRLSLARFLVLGLEFQLAADVLRTAISPSFSEIGKLAAIAAIRTLLNYFLNREIAQEQREIDALKRPPPP